MTLGTRDADSFGARQGLAFRGRTHYYKTALPHPLDFPGGSDGLVFVFVVIAELNILQMLVDDYSLQLKLSQSVPADVGIAVVEITVPFAAVFAAELLRFPAGDGVEGMSLPDSHRGRRLLAEAGGGAALSPVAPPPSEPGTSAAAATAGGGASAAGLPKGALPLPGKVSTSNMLGLGPAPRAASSGEPGAEATPPAAPGRSSRRGPPLRTSFLRRLQVVAMAMMAASSSVQLPASTMMMISGVSHCSAGPDVASREPGGRERSGFPAPAGDASPRPPPAVTTKLTVAVVESGGRPPSDMTSSARKTRPGGSCERSPQVEGQLPVGTLVCVPGLHARHRRVLRCAPGDRHFQGTVGGRRVHQDRGVVVLVKHPHLHQGTAGELRGAPVARLDAHVELAKRLVVEAAQRVDGPCRWVHGDVGGHGAPSPAHLGLQQPVGDLAVAAQVRVPGGHRGQRRVVVLVAHAHRVGPHCAQRGSAAVLGHQRQVVLGDALAVQGRRGHHQVAARVGRLQPEVLVPVEGATHLPIGTRVPVRGADQRHQALASRPLRHQRDGARLRRPRPGRRGGLRSPKSGGGGGEGRGSRRARGGQRGDGDVRSVVIDVAEAHDDLAGGGAGPGAAVLRPHVQFGHSGKQYSSRSRRTKSQQDAETWHEPGGNLTICL
ncbi:TPA: hypothetical protein BOS_12459 [Bos taurus]|nr:TPA: hypothetical protein BOS_12459 [Bos taurus]